mmetsp:Transcript_158323/g.503910  ORF Transcript_158323/g.503910 Transcript_158323/m.503910 type:complete len:96 (+) Transcript_158323:140-427(+)
MRILKPWARSSPRSTAIVLTLGRNHTTEKALQLLKSIALKATSGEVEVTASRFTRLLRANPGLEHLEELSLTNSGLSDEAGAAIAISSWRGQAQQ